MVRLTGPAGVDGPVSLFEALADAEGWQPQDALRLWVDHSVFFILEVDGQLAGGIQLVRPDGAGSLPYQEVWREVSVLRVAALTSPSWHSTRQSGATACSSGAWSWRCSAAL